MKNNRIVRIGQRIVLWGLYTGKITKTMAQDDGSFRYYVRWNHPSDRKPQRGWYTQKDFR